VAYELEPAFVISSIVARLDIMLSKQTKSWTRISTSLFSAYTKTNHSTKVSLRFCISSNALIEVVVQVHQQSCPTFFNPHSWPRYHQIRSVDHAYLSPCNAVGAYSIWCKINIGVLLIRSRLQTGSCIRLGPIAAVTLTFLLLTFGGKKISSIELHPNTLFQ